jgi:GGDEF domain-containing protein
MSFKGMEGVRVNALLSLALVAFACIILSAADSEALPVGAIVLLLIFAGHFSGLYRYADVAAAMGGMAGYVLLERGQGTPGIIALFLAAVCFAVTVVAARRLDSCMRQTETDAKKSQSLVDELTIYDDVSGLLKRRYGEMAIEEEISRARRTKTSLSLVLAAPDPVPEHPVELPPDEDVEAAAIGNVFREMLRVTDRMARLGGSTYIALLPATDAPGGAVVAEKLRRVCAERGVSPLRFAVATFPDNALSAADLLEEAFAALQLARTGAMHYAGPDMLAPTGS